MGKILFWVVVIVVALMGLRLANLAAAKRRERDAGARQARKADDTMVRCASCGVYLPRANALPAAGGYLCGDPGCVARR